MALTANNLMTTQMDNKTLEKVMIGQDLSGLSSFEKVTYLNGLCKSLGLNPLTKPFEIMKFQNKEIPYARKDCTEQLRKVHGVSIRSIETKTIMDNVYVVTAYAKTADGREDSSTGVVNIQGLKGDALANAIMKAETKAKRRVTLSICGLGFVDETEMETMPGARTINVVEEVKNSLLISEGIDIDEMLMDISQTNSLTELEDTFKSYYKCCINKKDKESLTRLIEAKDVKKSQLQEIETGEIENETTF